MGEQLPHHEAGDLSPGVTRRNAWKWASGAATFAMLARADGAAATTTTLDSRVSRLVRRSQSLTRQAIDRLVLSRIVEFEELVLPDLLGAQALSPSTPLRRALDPLYETSQTRDVTPALTSFLAALARRDTGPVRVVAAGSSTTAGGGATTVNRRYLNRLAVHTQRAHPLGSGAAQPATITLSETATIGTASLGVQFINAGVGGTTSQNYLTSATREQVANLAPMMVLHMVGSNDYAQSMQIATYIANLRAQIAALSAAIRSPCIHLLVHPFERNDVLGKQPGWSEYGDAMRQLAVEDPTRIAFLDLSNIYYGLGVPGPDPYEILAADRIHQTDHGHALMADVLHQRLSWR